MTANLKIAVSVLAVNLHTSNCCQSAKSIPFHAYNSSLLILTFRNVDRPDSSSIVQLGRHGARLVDVLFEIDSDTGNVIRSLLEQRTVRLYSNVIKRPSTNQLSLSPNASSVNG